MAKKRRKKTKAQIEYERQRAKVRMYARYHESDLELPYTPTQIKGRGNVKAKDYTEYTRELKTYYKQLKNYIKERDEYQDNSDIPDIADAYINNFINEIQKYKRADGRGIILAFLDNAISQYGKAGVAFGLIDAQNNGLQLTREIIYQESETRKFINDIVKFMKKFGGTKNQIRQLRQYADNNEEYNNV